MSTLWLVIHGPQTYHPRRSLLSRRGVFDCLHARLDDRTDADVGYSDDNVSTPVYDGHDYGRDTRDDRDDS